MRAVQVQVWLCPAVAAGAGPVGGSGADEACFRVWLKSLLFYAMKRVAQYMRGGGAKSMAHVAACFGAAGDGRCQSQSRRRVVPVAMLHGV